MGNLVKGQSLHVSDLVLGEGVKVVTHGKKNPVIAAVTIPKEEAEEVAPVAPVIAAAPADKKAKKTEKQNKK